MSAWKVIAALSAGLVLGLAVTWLTVFQGSLGMGSGRVSNGPWDTNLSIGSAASDPYTRASVAVHGLLALGRSETLYFTAYRDSAGKALDANCAYRIMGRDPDARWWSITAYAADDFLIPNPAGRYSVSKNSVRRDMRGDFLITVSRNAAPANWIPLDDGTFSLTLRLYNPGAAVAADPAHAALPRIENAGCA